MNTIYLSISEDTLLNIQRGLPTSSIADLHPPYKDNPIKATLHTYNLYKTSEENIDLFGTLHYTIKLSTQTLQTILPILTYYTRMGTDIHGTIEWVTGEQKHLTSTQTYLTVKDLQVATEKEPQTNAEASAKLIENWGQARE